MLKQILILLIVLFLLYLIYQNLKVVNDDIEALTVDIDLTLQPKKRISKEVYEPESKKSCKRRLYHVNDVVRAQAYTTKKKCKKYKRSCLIKKCKKYKKGKCRKYKCKKKGPKRCVKYKTIRKIDQKKQKSLIGGWFVNRDDKDNYNSAPAGVDRTRLRRLGRVQRAIKSNNKNRRGRNRNRRRIRRHCRRRNNRQMMPVTKWWNRWANTNHLETLYIYGKNDSSSPETVLTELKFTGNDKKLTDDDADTGKTISFNGINIPEETIITGYGLAVGPTDGVALQNHGIKFSVLNDNSEEIQSTTGSTGGVGWIKGTTHKWTLPNPFELKITSNGVTNASSMGKDY